MTDPKKLYSVKWPLAARHCTESVSGVLVETNLHRQLALHFYNETRGLEEEVAYDEEGQRQSDVRNPAYSREIVETILLSDSAAMNLRDLLNATFPAEQSGTVS